jgi:hypothetical protein
LTFDSSINNFLILENSVVLNLISELVALIEKAFKHDTHGMSRLNCLKFIFCRKNFVHKFLHSQLYF